MSESMLNFLSFILCPIILIYLSSYKWRPKGEDAVLNDLLKFKNFLERNKEKLLHPAMIVIPLKNKQVVRAKKT